MKIDAALKLLCLSAPFTADQLKRAYRQKALESHPDHSGDTVKFMQIKKAYDALLDSLTNTSSREKFTRARFRQKNLDIEIVKEVSFKVSCAGGVVSVGFTKSKTSLNQKISENKIKKVRIAPGLKDGAVLVFSEEGHEFESFKGDLRIKLKTIEDVRLKRNGLDVIQTAGVTYSQILLQKKITALTVHGDVSVKIPPDSFDGDKISIDGYGIRNKQGTGCHIVKLRLIAPEKLRKDQIEALKNLERVGL